MQSRDMQKPIINNERLRLKQRIIISDVLGRKQFKLKSNVAKTTS